MGPEFLCFLISVVVNMVDKKYPQAQKHGSIFKSF